MYWEVYAGQSVDGFNYVGFDDYREPIQDIESQIAELRRTNGSSAEIRIYKEEA